MKSTKNHNPTPHPSKIVIFEKFVKKLNTKIQSVTLLDIPFPRWSEAFKTTILTHLGFGLGLVFGLGSVLRLGLRLGLGLGLGSRLGHGSIL
jgi:hypothetical protein